ELGRDADTGGQIKYVVELAKFLSEQAPVDRVDLFTRQIFDKKVSPDYAQSEEPIAPGALIVRKPFGPKRYLRKEVLWPYLDHFANEILKHFRAIGRMPDILHAHYADAGYVGAKLAQLLGIPLIFTGHSLGRVKRKRLLEQGMPEETIASRYNIYERIEAEETALATASMVVTSTHQEVEEQYQLYEQYQPETMEVIPPGTDLSRFNPSRNPLSRFSYYATLKRFLNDPNKPMILAISRADERKNIVSLIQAYAESETLREGANLVIVAGNRDDLRQLNSGAKEVIRNILYLIDKYDLYGSIAFPKHHTANDVPDLYRMCAKTQGVFVNPALTEPFGLTLIEAAACGTPIVATNDGGPRDIISNCRNGILIDPLNTDEIAEAIETMLLDRDQWRQYSQNGLKGVKRYYSWTNHAKTYLQRIKRHMKTSRKKPFYISSGKRLLKAARLVITDIDNTLLGDKESLDELMALIHNRPNIVGFGIATGRHIESAVNVLQEWNVPRPDLLITSVGSEIHYGDDLKQDRDWERHIDYKWEPESLREFMSSLPGIEPQPEENQRKHKVSFYIDPSIAPSRRDIVRLMRENRFHVKVIHSHQQFLDFLPLRASKGLAIWYMASKWGIPMEHILTAGDSGNDEEMLKGYNLSVVVGNYSAELEPLRKNPTVYFAQASYAGGILEGMNYFDFMGEIKRPAEENA
ncbi:MAG: HAD-IIB family hydrolase, partial [Candidatus Hinthialibacter sp.]